MLIQKNQVNRLLLSKIQLHGSNIFTTLSYLLKKNIFLTLCVFLVKHLEKQGIIFFLI